MKNLQDFTVQDYLRIVRRRMWYLILTTILVSVGAGIYVWRMQSVYKSETTILVSDRLVPEDYIGSLVRQSVMDRIEFAKQQLRSRTFIERIAQEFQLGGGETDTDLVLNAIITNTEVTVVPPNVFKVGFYATDPNTAQAVTRRLAERVTQTNDIFRQEKVSGTDQFLDEQLRQATDVLAQAEQKLADFNQKNFPGLPQQGVNMDTFGLLQSQLGKAESELATALDQRTAYERTLAEHKELKGAAILPQPIPTAAPSTPVTPSRPAPSLLEQKLAQKQQELAALLTRYKPGHPDVLRLAREVRDLTTEFQNRPAEKDPEIAAPEVKSDAKALPEIDVSVDFYEAEVRRELGQLDKEIARMEADKKALLSRVATYGRRINMPADVMQEFATLSQDRDSAKQQYSYLSTKKLNSDLAGKVDTDANNKTFSTIDPPNLPQTPVRPNRPILTAVGCLAGLMLGIGLAFAREMLDPTLSDEDAAAAELEIRVLTSIPTVGDTSRNEKKLARMRKNRALVLRKQHPLTLASEQSASEPAKEFSIQTAENRIRDVIFHRSGIANEQYQMLRADLAVQRQRGLKSLIITSAVPDEGKTFVACCLAAMLAKEQDKKVLLIDGDLRTGSARQALRIDSPSSRNGLSNVLTGEIDVENCLIPCADLNLSFLPAGRSVENPVELLSSPRLQQMMRDLTLLFDWIIVDSPPVLPIADTAVLNTVCDAAIVVVRADRTPASLVKEVIKKIGQERVTGVVLNGVRNIKAKHYYGRYYAHVSQAQK